MRTRLKIPIASPAKVPANSRSRGAGRPRKGQAAPSRREGPAVGELRLVPAARDKRSFIDVAQRPLEPPVVDRVRPAEGKKLNGSNVALADVGNEYHDPLLIGSFFPAAAGGRDDLEAQLGLGVDDDGLLGAASPPSFPVIRHNPWRERASLQCQRDDTLPAEMA